MASRRVGLLNLSCLRTFSSTPSFPLAFSLPFEKHESSGGLWKTKELPEIPHQYLDPSTPRPSSFGMTKAFLPFSQGGQLMDQYLSPWGRLRVGKLFEDLDALCGNVAVLYSRGLFGSGLDSQQVSFVTASVDRLVLLERIPHPTVDLEIVGEPLWVGKSSMEVGAEIWAGDLKILESRFVMVGRHPKGKPVSLPPMLVNKNTEKHLEEAIQRRQLRLERRKTSLLRLGGMPPTEEESSLLHHIFIKTQIEPDAPISQNYVRIGNTLTRSLILCQPSERNIMGRIFGGFLIRSAFELAYSSAFLFAKRSPYFSALDDITFLKPVEIGDILKFSARCIYTNYTGKDDVQVEVLVHTVDPVASKQSHTNAMYFSFDLPELQDKPPPIVLPSNYEEGMRYLEGRRRWQRHHG